MIVQLTIHPNNHRLNSHVLQLFPTPNSPRSNIQCRSSVEDVERSQIF